MESAKGGGGPELTEAQAFCREVVAGRPAGSLPGDALERGRVLELLQALRLLGLWVAEERGAADPRVRAVVAFQALRGELTMDAAARAADALAEGGFQVLLFKGAGLVRSGVYPDAGARALGDGDLLVRGGDPAGAVRLLEEGGFRPWVPWEAGRSAWLPAFTLADARVPEGLDVTVDLHWRIPYGTYRSGTEADDASLWEGADLLRGVPAPEVHTLLVAEHFVRHLRVLPHVVGLADLVRLVPLVQEPEWLAGLARRRRALRLLRSLLWLLRAELGVALPGPLVEAVAVPERIGRLRARALRLDRLLVTPRGRREDRITGVVSQALLQGSALDFLGEVARVVHPPADWLAQRRGGGGGPARRRLGYWWELLAWAAGRGISPLSPNQELEPPGGRR